jgi:hypothetical protein
MHEEGGYYKLAGDCFVYGMMRGEMMGQHDEGASKAEWFELR